MFVLAFSNDDDSEYEDDDGGGVGKAEGHRSYVDDNSANGPATTLGHSVKSNFFLEIIRFVEHFNILWGYVCFALVGRKKPYQYLSMAKRAIPMDNQTIAGRNSSSASNHDSSGQNNNDESTSTSTSSDDSGNSDRTSRSSHHQHAHNGDLQQQNHSASDLLTEDAVRQHNADYEPMNSKERIKFWRISEEFNEIEDDFDEKRNFSKPIRSERVS